VRRSEDGGYEEDDIHVEQVRHRVSEEIGHVMWREHINYDHIHDLQMPNDGHQCLWNKGCGHPAWHPIFCSLRCRIRSESFDFLYRFPMIQAIVDDVDM
jgi:hypothetical protein